MTSYDCETRIWINNDEKRKKVINVVSEAVNRMQEDGLFELLEEYGYETTDLRDGDSHHISLLIPVLCPKRTWRYLESEVHGQRTFLNGITDLPEKHCIILSTYGEVPYEFLKLLCYTAGPAVVYVGREGEDNEDEDEEAFDSYEPVNEEEEDEASELAGLFERLADQLRDIADTVEIISEKMK